MSSSPYTIKVSDITSKKQSSGCIEIRNASSVLLGKEYGKISCDVYLLGGEEGLILLSIENISLTKQTICDSCTKELNLDVSIDKRVLKGIGQDDEYELQEDEIFFDTKFGRIDIEEFIYQEIHLQESVVNLCTECQNKKPSEDDDLIESTTIVRKKGK